MIKNEFRKSQLFSVMAIISILGLVYWLDTVTISWRRQARAEGNMIPFLYFYSALPFIFAILAIFLLWLLLVRFKPTWVTLIFCLLIGISFFVSIAPGNSILYQIVSSAGFIFISVYGVFAHLGTNSMTFQMGAFILVIGLINLIRILMTVKQKSL
jgi:hypothetical protein